MPVVRRRSIAGVEDFSDPIEIPPDMPVVVDHGGLDAVTPITTRNLVPDIGPDLPDAFIERRRGEPRSLREVPPDVPPHSHGMGGVEGLLDALQELQDQIDAGSSLRHEVAGTQLSALRMVYIGDSGRCYYASNDADSVAVVYGLTISAAAAAGDDLQVLSAGPWEDAFWNWTPELPIFLGENGTLTQASPAGRTEVIVGIALTATRMLVRIEPPLY